VAAASLTSFPFTLPSGYKLNGNFTSPSAFDAFFNRGWRGKVGVYLGGLTAPVAATHTAAIAALTTAINAAGGTAAASTLSKGVYFTYSTAAGETSNPWSDAAIHANQQLCDSVAVGDLRGSKLTALSTAVSSPAGVSTKCNIN